MIERSYSLLDIHFAEFLAKRSGLSSKRRQVFQELVQRLSAALSAGDTCLVVNGGEQEVLKETSLVSKKEATPLVLSRGRLYLQKYFLYETRLASTLAQMSQVDHELSGSISLVEQCFPSHDSVEIDWQKEAAVKALKKNLCIISGGPGTGKTSTIVRIIGLLLQCQEQTVVLAAPTGKAAMRLRASLVNSLTQLTFPEEILAKIPQEAMTLHRLLGVRRNSSQFRHNHRNPLVWDTVVVDEASMVDLALMSKLVDAIKPGGRLVLLGDKDQLSSVESGAVLSDLITSLPENTVELKKTYRFDVGIKKLASLCNLGKGLAAWGMLTSNEFENVRMVHTSHIESIGEPFMPYMKKVEGTTGESINELSSLFNRFKILCCIRHGTFGVEEMNNRVEKYFHGLGFDTSSQWYPGKPVLITRNEYNLDLYNGDVGLCLPDQKDGRLKVWFEKADGGWKPFLPNRLPVCEKAYAMTIHKSQGSEFEKVLVVLPRDENRVLSRELIYTAITRAKNEVQLMAERDILITALARKLNRVSGLSSSIRKALNFLGNDSD